MLLQPSFASKHSMSRIGKIDGEGLPKGILCIHRGKMWVPKSSELFVFISWIWTIGQNSLRQMQIALPGAATEKGGARRDGARAAEIMQLSASRPYRFRVVMIVQHIPSSSPSAFFVYRIIVLEYLSHVRSEFHEASFPFIFISCLKSKSQGFVFVGMPTVWC